ncbi:hypothetical protein SAMN05421788_109166 [Filimonas lacunae]|uniref:Uncharacterized protein n=1 Tax=Filimonas lacunae TaxID=477680 RepID=A0A1N7R520_9BACT|nr:hypothetical protein SAMN05421788_109166 [Filimonas lacunae]
MVCVQVPGDVEVYTEEIVVVQYAGVPVHYGREVCTENNVLVQYGPAPLHNCAYNVPRRAYNVTDDREVCTEEIVRV